MKHIPLKRLEAPGQSAMDYALVLAEVLKRPLNPQQGATIEEMRQSIRVLDALEAANGMLDLEDADYQHLKQKVEAMPWNVIDRRLVQLVEDVSNA